MPVPACFRQRLRLPILGAPMFLASGPELVIAQCLAGIAASFPALNARPAEALGEWIRTIQMDLSRRDARHTGYPAAPFGVNLILHDSNDRQEKDLETICRHEVPFVITSVGKPDRVVKRVHAYGGAVFHDVISAEHARKAIDVGVDGLILVCAGAGGHGGDLSPLALVREVRAFWQGPLIVGGGISDGHAIRAIEVLGADLAYMGTRFLATRESAACDEHKRMMLEASSGDLIYTDAFSGIRANYLKASLRRSGLDPNAVAKAPDTRRLFADLDRRPQAWKEVWSAGQGVGSIYDIPSTAGLVSRLEAEYRAAHIPDRNHALIPYP